MLQVLDVGAHKREFRVPSTDDVASKLVSCDLDRFVAVGLVALVLVVVSHGTAVIEQSHVRACDISCIGVSKETRAQIPFFRIGITEAYQDPPVW